MYDKNGKLTLVSQAIFNSGMERLRNGDRPIDIAKDLKVQVKLVEFNGDELEAKQSLRRGYGFYCIHILELYAGKWEPQGPIKLFPPVDKPKPSLMDHWFFAPFNKPSKGIVITNL